VYIVYDVYEMYYEGSILNVFMKPMYVYKVHMSVHLSVKLLRNRLQLKPASFVCRIGHIPTLPSSLFQKTPNPSHKLTQSFNFTLRCAIICSSLCLPH
jgi:hypothetical protein